MANKVFDEYIKIKDARKDAMEFLSESISYVSVPQESENLKEDFVKIIKHTTMSMKSMAHAYYKSEAFLEVSDIEQIKASLANFAREDVKMDLFKKELIGDLTEIQNKIKVKYSQKIKKMGEEKAQCERQVKVLEFSKSKLIMDRLSKIQWPYDSKTQEFDKNIALLNLKIEKYSKSIEDMKNKRPSADEKDLLIYQIELKEKYIKG